MTPPVRKRSGGLHNYFDTDFVRRPAGIGTKPFRSRYFNTSPFGDAVTRRGVSWLTWLLEFSVRWRQRLRSGPCILKSRPAMIWSVSRNEAMARWVSLIHRVECLSIRMLIAL